MRYFDNKWWTSTNSLNKNISPHANGILNFSFKKLWFVRCSCPIETAEWTQKRTDVECWSSDVTISIWITFLCEGFNSLFIVFAAPSAAQIRAAGCDDHAFTSFTGRCTDTTTFWYERLTCVGTAVPCFPCSACRYRLFNAIDCYVSVFQYAVICRSVIVISWNQRWTLNFTYSFYGNSVHSHPK